MTTAHDQLVARLEAILVSLEAKDAEAVASAMDATVAAFASAERPWADPRILSLYRACQERAATLLSSLQQELGQHATSRRAAAAYGDGS